MIDWENWAPNCLFVGIIVSVIYQHNKPLRNMCLVAHLYPTLWDPMDYSPPGSSIHGIFQARELEWVAIPFSRGFQGGSRGKELTCQCWRRKVMRVWSFDPSVGKISWRKSWQPTPVFLPGEFHGQWSLVGYSPWGLKELNPIEQLTLLHRNRN